MTAPRTMFEKIWQRHVVVDRPDGYTLLYIDRHLMHDGSSPAYARLKARGMGLRRPDRAAATPDHYVKTDQPLEGRARSRPSAAAERHHQELQRSGRHAVRPRRRPPGHRPCRRPRAGPQPARHDPGLRRLPHLDARRARRARLRHRLVGSDARAGDAVPVAAQAQDDAHHASTARSAPASPARTSSSPSSRKIGAAGAVGHVIEYAGSAIRGLSMEGRLTLCNMSIEAGARAGMVAPDDTTFALPEGPAVRAQGRRTGTRRWPSGAPCRPTTARRSTAKSRSTPPRSRRW